MTQHIENYWYIGKDGKPITAKELEDQRDEAREEIERLRAALLRISGIKQVGPWGDEQPSYEAKIALEALK